MLEPTKNSIFFMLKSSLKIVVLIGLFTIIGCSSILKGLTGIKDPNKAINTKIKSKKYFKLIPEKLYTVNYDSFLSFYSFIALTDTILSKNIYQPLQVRLFKDDSLIFFINNCTVGGFPNLNWNRYGSFNELNLNRKYVTLNDTIFNSLRIIKRIIVPELNNEKEFKLITFWSSFMGRQTKRLIKQTNIFYQNNKSDIEVIYVNIDTLYSKLEVNSSKN